MRFRSHNDNIDKRSDSPVIHQTTTCLKYVVKDFLFFSGRWLQGEQPRNLQSFKS